MACYLQTADIPVVLGPAGTALAALIILAQSVMTFYSWRKSTAVKILRDELEAYKGKTARLEAEMKSVEAEMKSVRDDEDDCRRRLDRLTKLYLDAKGQEEDGHKR